MSTGLNCAYVEIEPGKWYYMLESDFGCKNSFDWLEDAQVVGPFETFEKAHSYLHGCNANPGSYFKISHEGMEDRERKRYGEVVGRARKPCPVRAQSWKIYG